MYRLIRPLLFCLPPEYSHHFAMKCLAIVDRLKLSAPLANRQQSPRRIMGLQFENPLGLAAGFDKNADYLSQLSKLGFGFIEVGTVTPRPQFGNDKPRLFRLPNNRALINRMGFNNLGVDHLINNVKKARFDGVLGINIGKNRDTSIARATEDYLFCLEKVYQYADYITLNISSPNTPGLRNLQYGDYLIDLLTQVKTKQKLLAAIYKKYVPIALKVAPDLATDEINLIAQHLLEFEIDCLIATNTTICRDQLSAEVNMHEEGGLSGAPLKRKARDTVSAFSDILADKIPIIGVGGVMIGDDARALLNAGANLVQIYTGFIYHGPHLIQDCVAAMKA